MGRVVVFMSPTLDGVMQSPGRPDEDTRGGFEHGGWGVRYADSVSGSMVGRYAGTTEGLLLGRRTYEDFFQVWPNRTDNPFTDALNKAQKYVASKTLSELCQSNHDQGLDRHLPSGRFGRLMPCR